MSQEKGNTNSPLDGFLSELWKDIRDGHVRPLPEYLARFPGDETRIAANYADVLEPRERISLPTAPSLAAASLGREAGRLIGPYRLVREIGRGGQGIVFLAEDTRLGRQVALKVVTSTITSSPQMFARFAREAKAASKIDHPGICTIFDTGEHEGLHYIVMRYLDGETLAQLIGEARKHAGPATGTITLPDPAGDVPSFVAPGSQMRARIMRVVALIEESARAIQAAHAAGIIHRDLKPGNIMVGHAGRPTILDFGLARDLQSEAAPMTLSGDVLGTPAYMSPEQLLASHTPLDARTDVFSLGVTLFECLTLRRPVEPATRETLIHAVQHLDPQPRRLNAAIPRDLEIVIQTALEKDLDRRYPSAGILADELRRVRCDEPILARPAPWHLRARRWMRRHPRRVTAAGVLALTLMALTPWLIRGAPKRGLLHVTTPHGEVSIVLSPTSGKGAPDRRSVTGSAELQLEAGTYRVTAEKRNWIGRTVGDAVRIVADETTSINVTLEPVLGRDSFELPARNYVRAGVADFDEDGRLDLLLASHQFGQDGWTIKAISRNHAVPLWRAEAPDGRASDIELADYDRDGIPDAAVLIQSPSGLSILSGRDGSTIWRYALGAESWSALTAADLDGDGAPDVVVASGGRIRAFSPARNAEIWSVAAEGAQTTAGVIGLELVPDEGGRLAILLARHLGPEPVSELSLRNGSDGKELWTRRVPARVTCLGPSEPGAVWFGTSDGRVGRVSADPEEPMSAPEADEVVAILDVGPKSDAKPTFAAVHSSGLVATFGGGRSGQLGSRRVLDPGRVICRSIVTFSRDAADGPGELVLASTTEGSDGDRGARIDFIPLGAGETRTFHLDDEVPLRAIIADFDNDGATEALVITTDGRSPPVCSARILNFRDTGLLWRAATAGAIWSGPAVSEAAGRARTVFVGSKDRRVYAFDGRDGHLMWSAATDGPVYASPSVGDLNGDGIEDCVVGSDDGSLYAFSGDTGRLLWSPFKTGGEIFGRAALADQDGDGRPDIVFAAKDGFIRILRGLDGKPIVPAFPTDDTRGFHSSPRLLHLDAASCFDIAIGTMDGRLCVFSGADGRKLVDVRIDRHRSRELDVQIRSSPASADLDGDGVPDLVVGGADGWVYAVACGGTPHVLWEAPANNRPVDSSPRLADLNGDGVPDVIVGGSEGQAKGPGCGVIALSGKNGSRLWEFRTDGGTWSTPAVAEVDGDGVPDVVIGSADSHCYVISGRNGSLIRRIRVTDRVYSSPTIADVNGDGVPEAVFGCYDGQIYAVSLLPREAKARGRVSPLMRAREHLAAHAYEAAASDPGDDPAPTPELRLARARALVLLDRFREAGPDLDAAAAAGLRAPDLGILLLLRAVHDRTSADPALVASCVLTDPARFVAGLWESAPSDPSLDPGLVRAALEPVLASLPTGPGAHHVNATLADAALRVLLGRPKDDAAPHPAEADPVRADQLRVLEALARIIDGKAASLTAMATEPGKRFADLWPTHPAALREKLRLPPRR
jgi:serine/threonine protein kinase/outer membrane protein assembly factor BamB